MPWRGRTTIDSPGASRSSPAARAVSAPRSRDGSSPRVPASASIDIGGTAAGRCPGARRGRLGLGADRGGARTHRGRARPRRRPRVRGRDPGRLALHRRRHRRGVAPCHVDRRGRRLLLQPRRPARDGRARLRQDRQRRVHRRQGGQPDGRRLLVGEGGGDRDDEGDREGRRAHGCPRQLHRPRRDRDADPRRACRRSTSTT